MSDTHALDHRAVLLPIKVKPVTRPAFDNTHIDDQRRWIDANSLTLARYFYELGDRKIVPTPGAELQRWTRMQHEIEVIRQARMVLP